MLLFPGTCHYGSAVCHRLCLCHIIRPWIVTIVPLFTAPLSCVICVLWTVSSFVQLIPRLQRIYFITGEYGMTLLCFSSTKMNDNCVFLFSIQQSRVVLTGKSNIFEILSMTLFQSVAVQHSLGRKWVHHAGWDRLMKRVSTRLKHIAPVWEYTYLH